MKIGIIGGGMMGLQLAHHLSKYDNKITIFEREKQLGGLATYHDYDLFIWDRFYHVILPTDTDLIRFLEDINLGDELRWKNTLTGFFVDEKLFSMSSTKEFLRFPPLNIIDKARLAFTILYCAKINNWQELEKKKVTDWLRSLTGKRAFDKMWKPLLKAKLGDAYERTSAVFIWTYIKRMYSAKSASTQKEQLGYVKGGYWRILTRIEEVLNAKSVTIKRNITINKVKTGDMDKLLINHSGKTETFDKVIFTGPVNVLQAIASKDLVDFTAANRSVEYLGVICMVLITKSPITPYYIVNIADDSIPFTGIIGVSNIVNTEETANLHISYLPKYVESNDPVLDENDENIKNIFLAGLHQLVPDYKFDDIVDIHINRAKKVQPLQVLEYSKIIPSFKTKNRNFYVVNTSQFVNDTLNNNSVTRNVNKFIQENGFQFKS